MTGDCHVRFCESREVKFLLPTRLPGTLAVIVKIKPDDKMTKEFLLHKDTENNTERATAQISHLVLPDTQSDPSQNQKSHFFATALKQIDND